MKAALKSHDVNPQLKRCAWCSDQAEKTVQHPIAEFGPSNYTNDELKSSCRMSFSIRERQANKKKRAEKIKKAGPGSRAWFRARSEYDHNYISDEDLMRQNFLLRTWR